MTLESSGMTRRKVYVAGMATAVFHQIKILQLVWDITSLGLLGVLREEKFSLHDFYLFPTQI